MKDKLIIGRKPILDGLKQGTEFEKVWISKTLKGDIEKDIRNLTREQAVPLQYVPKEKLNDISKSRLHQGVVAQLSLVNYMTVEEVIPFLYESEGTPRILVLDGIEDVRNIGALARSAVWFGFHAIVVALKRNARINSVAFKTSAGALKDIILCREVSMIKTIQMLKDSGIEIMVADGRAHDDTLDQVNKEGPIALVLGSEDKGVSREIKALSDHQVRIPGTGKVESLNVSVAGALLMAEIYKSNIKKK